MLDEQTIPRGRRISLKLGGSCPFKIKHKQKPAGGKQDHGDKHRPCQGLRRHKRKSAQNDKRPYQAGNGHIIVIAHPCSSTGGSRLSGGTLARIGQLQTFRDRLFICHFRLGPLFLQDCFLGLLVQHHNTDPAIDRVERVILVEQYG